MVADQLVGREVIRGVRMRIKGDEARSDKNEQAMCVLGPDISTTIRNFACRAWRLYHRQWKVIMDIFRSLILPGFFRIGVNAPQISPLSLNRRETDV